MRQQVFWGEYLSNVAVLRYNKCFKYGRESTEDKSRTGRPSTSRNEDNVQCVRDVWSSDRRLSFRMIAVFSHRYV